MAKPAQFEVWTADLSTQSGTEVGKIHPVLVIQGNYLNSSHSSTIILPITTKLNNRVSILRIRIQNGEAGLSQDSDIILDQIRAIDNARFVKKIGWLSENLAQTVQTNLCHILEIDF